MFLTNSRSYKTLGLLTDDKVGLLFLCTDHSMMISVHFIDIDYSEIRKLRITKLFINKCEISNLN